MAPATLGLSVLCSLSNSASVHIFVVGSTVFLKCLTFIQYYDLSIWPMALMPWKLVLWNCANTTQTHPKSSDNCTVTHPMSYM